MFSIAFRSCQVSFVRNGYSKINNQYAFAALVSRKYVSTLFANFTIKNIYLFPTL